MKLIDKDALVAEIERRRNECINSLMTEQVHTLSDMLDFINTPEVKEVDLDYIKEELDRLIRIQKPDGDFGWGTLYNVATHFFELGLKTQKGEEV